MHSLRHVCCLFAQVTVSRRAREKVKGLHVAAFLSGIYNPERLTLIMHGDMAPQTFQCFTGGEKKRHHEIRSRSRVGSR